MALKLRDPNIEIQPIEQIVHNGDEIGLINPATANPVTFHPVVMNCDERSLTLDLPEKFWELMQVTPGLAVQITKTGSDKMYYIEGNVHEAQKGDQSKLVVSHDGKMMSAQRRLFYRFNLKTHCQFNDVLLPDGKKVEKVKAVIQDMSPAGIGFKTSQRLPRDTRFEVGDLFRPTIPEMEELDYFMQVMWVKGSRLFGFRHGAVFRFASEKDQDAFGRVLSQLQINRLSWYYHQARNATETG